MLQDKVEREGKDPDDTRYDADGFINSASKIKEFHDTYPKEARRFDCKSGWKLYKER